MISTPPFISAIIIVNPNWFSDLKLLPGCLESIKFVDEIIFIPSEDNAQLNKLAKKYQAKIINQQGGKFANWRNLGAEKATGKWLFYIDADERSSEKLNQEILSIISPPSSDLTLKQKIQAAYAIPRSNKILGKEFRYGGWWPDYVLRLMQKDKFKKWEGDLHEQPKINGDIGYLRNHLLHIKFQKLENYVTKTVAWSSNEAQLYLKANHPRLTVLRFFRLCIDPFMTSLINRLLIKKGILDGTKGLIDAIYQSYSLFINYARLWELQLNNQLKTKN